MDRNLFLHGLPSATFEALSPHLSLVTLEQRSTLMHAGQPVQWVHFPVTGLVSLIALDSDGCSVEASMVGNEGACGLIEVMGSGEAAIEFTVQVGGTAWRCSANAARSIVESDPALRTHLWKFLEFQLAEARRSSLCLASHPADRRMSRWLLESSDRVGGSSMLPLTQDYLAAMLGVQRTTVTEIATGMQKAGLIRYSRGKIDLVDRDGLEAHACDCRAFTCEQRHRLGLK